MQAEGRLLLQKDGYRLALAYRTQHASGIVGTSAARTPDQLPAAEDPHLEQVIQEAIDIVNSIHYKRCAPTSSFHPH